MVDIATEAPVHSAPRLRLAIAYFLQFATWGIWTVPLGNYLSVTRGWGDIVGLAYAMQGIAAIVAPLIVGLIADRNISAQKLMGCLYVGAAAFMFVIPALTSNRVLFLAALLGHFLCFIPTLALSNTIGLTVIADPKKRFPAVRGFGTIGWICVGLFVGLVPGVANSDQPMTFAAWGCLVAGAYSFTLPNVPPADQRAPVKLSALLGIDVLRHADSRNLRIFLVTSFCAVVPLAFYYGYGNVFLNQMHAHIRFGPFNAGPTALQTVYQMAELAILFSLPIFIRRASVGPVIATGLVTWVCSFSLFAFGSRAENGLIFWLLATVLQGVSYSCLFTAGAIHIDSACRDADCARAQSLFSTITMGLGPVVGAVIASVVFAKTQQIGAADWQAFWTVPGFLCVAALVYFLLRFRGRRKTSGPIELAGKCPAGEA